MDGIAARTTTTRSRVVVVDQDEGFVAAADLHDPWHPNAAGEQKMADKWMQALAAGPLARLRLRWDAGGNSLLWDLPGEAEGTRLYAGTVAALADTDADGVPDSGSGDCLVALPAATASFSPAAQPAPGEALFYLLEIESLGTAWGMGSSSSGLVRVPGVTCP